LNINTDTHEGFKKVPVIWVTAERSFQIKNSEDLHDSDGALIYPLITVGRTGFSKDIAKKGAIYAPLDPEVMIIEAEQSKSQNRLIKIKLPTLQMRMLLKANSRRQINFPLPKNRNKTVYKTVSIPIPVYIEATYEIQFEIILSTTNKSNGFSVCNKYWWFKLFSFKRNGHFYEAFIQTDYATSDNINSIGLKMKEHLNQK
jgi:hypothetical protein